jgi:hypothetical protein
MTDEKPKGDCDWMPSIWPRDVSEALMMMMMEMMEGGRRRGS